MKKKALITLLAIIVLVGTVSLITSVERAKARNALAAYKAQLRAQGEKLTFQEAGYPFPLETNSNLENFVTLANRLDGISTLPGQLDYTKLLVEGRLSMMWQAAEPPDPESISWQELSSDCQKAAETLAELRAELEHPPRYFGWDLANPFSVQPKNPFVEKRKVAQFLGADAIVALREHNLPAAQSDLHALTQLAQVHRDDLNFVSVMIRIAISGLALEVTRQALPAKGWDDQSLLALQRDWEAVYLVRALETGLVGGRMMGVETFKMVRNHSSITGQAATSGMSSIRGNLWNVWYRSVVETDELYFLQQHQAQIESVRKLGSTASGKSVRDELIKRQATIDATSTSFVGQYKHILSSIALLNCLRAFETTARFETDRRMTITAIALKRYHLRNGRYPTALAELVPQFLAAELIDPWSCKLFRYRLNPDGTFTLYSVGEDGRDDGGDPAPAQATNSPPDLWTGKDAVWPTPVFPAAP